SRRRHTRCYRDWSSDVCSSDLAAYAGTKGARRPEDVTSGLLREFVYELKDLGLAPATIRRQISAVRTYYRYLVGEGHATRDPSEIGRASCRERGQRWGGRVPYA